MKIAINDLVFEYAAGQRALDGVNLTIEGTEPVAIIGQNGAGKTTLVKQLNAILRPTSGSISINGVDTSEYSCAQWSARVGYVFQNPDSQLFLETVRREFEFGPLSLGHSREMIDELLPRVAELCGLAEYLDENPADLSPSQKKFCAMGSVLMMRPEVVIFDEPTCGQDMAGIRRLEHIIRGLHDEGKLCITISHDVKFVTRCFPRVVVMCQGRVLDQGPTEEVFSHVGLLKKSFVIPPPVARVASAAGLGESVFSVNDLVERVEEERNC